ncbi:MAG: hypothetical protein K2K22_03650 [Muribaculaceae bacterium]|nr:hypothetical protein [Muribaculaceae bacterium]
MGKLALFDMLFNTHSSDSKKRKTEYPSYTRRYDYDYEDCDCGSSSAYSGHSCQNDTSWHDSYDSYDSYDNYSSYGDHDDEW